MRYFILILTVCFFSSCNDANYDDCMMISNSDIDYDSKSECDSVISQSFAYPYCLEFDIFTEAYGDEKYYTFLVLNARGYAIYDVDPFLYYRDDNDNPVVVAEPILYQLYQGSSKIWFDERGLTTSVAESYDMENDIVVYDNVKVGDQIAIFASKEKYTDEDLRTHSGDINYFTKVSESFKCYYITTLKNRTTIGYGMWSPDWWG